MNEDLARTIAILSLVATAGGLGLAVLSCRRPARIRIPLELGMLCISFAALPIIAAVTGVHTDPVFAAGAVGVGLVVGGYQGSHLSVERKDSRLLAQRSAPALAAWGTGIVLVQVASAASRAGVLEAGQALSYFGAAMSFGLIVGRQGVLNRLALPGLLVLAGALAGVLAGGAVEDATAQAPPPTPAPKVLKPTGTIDAQPYIKELEKGLQAGSLVQSTRSQLTFEFTDAGGAVKGDGQLVLEDFHVGMLIAIAEGLGSAIGDAVTGGGGGGGSTPNPVAAELANCRGNWTFTFKIDGTYDKSSGKLTGNYVAQQQFSDLRNCPARAGDITKPQPPSKAQPWNGTFDGNAVSGTLTSTQAGTPSLPFSARLPEEKTPAAVAPAAAVSPAAGAAPSTSPTAKETGEVILPPPIAIEELTPKEGAGASLVGLGAVAIVAVGAMAQTAGAAPMVPKGKPKEEPELDTIAVPAGPQPVTPENIDWAIQNVARMAQEAGYGDIVRAIDRGLQAGTLKPEDLEHLREVLMRRKELEEYMANSELFTQSDTDFFVGRCQKDAAWLATKVGHPEIAWIIEHPGMAARIAAGIATEGVSETFMTAWDVGEAVSNVVNRPGDASASAVMKEAAAAAAIETAWQVVPGAAIEKGIGIAMGRAASQEARVIAQEGREGLEAAGRGAARELAETTARSADDLTEAAAHSADDAAEATARSADDVAEAGARNADEAAGAPKPPPDTPPASAPRPGDNTWLKQAPDGTPIPPERLPEAGYTHDQAEAMRKVAEEENVLIGTRTTNPHSPHLDGEPKWVDIKSKTTNDADTLLGARIEDRGKVTLFEPKDPGVRSGPVWERYKSRLDEFKTLKPDVDRLVAEGKITWDPKTGVLYDARTGLPFIGDIDPVYVRDATSGALIAPDDPRYARVMQKLADSPARMQHRAEISQIGDQLAAKGATPEHWDEAMELNRKLSEAHEQGRETVIETSAGGWQKGPSPMGMADQHSPVPGGFLRRGLPIGIPDDETLRAAGQLPPKPE